MIQETRLAVWGPKDIAFVGEPRHWNITGRQTWSFWNPMVSPTAEQEAERFDNWIGADGGGAEFSQQGNVTVYRALGRQSQIKIVWWNRPFLVTVICGAILFVGFILRHTSWENRLTLTIVGCLGIALWSLKDSSETLQFVSAGSLGLVAVAGIWLVSFLVGPKTGHIVDNTISDNDEPNEGGDSNDKPPAPDPEPKPEPNAPKPADEQPSATMEASSPPAAITPSPEVTKLMDDLMGGQS